MVVWSLRDELFLKVFVLMFSFWHEDTMKTYFIHGGNFLIQ